MDALENEIDRNLSGSVVSPESHVGGQYSDCLEQDEADRSTST